jgi:endonuclease YncB( thermonuclease family)
MSPPVCAIFFGIEARLKVIFCSTLITTVVLLFTCYNATSAEPNVVGKVVEVIDGDTLTLLDADSSMRRVRLSGIDAPETGQPFAHISQRYLMDLAYGKLVSATCPKVDRYRRDVCTVWVDGIDVSLALLRAGLAWHFIRYAHEQPAKEREAYAEAQLTAQKGHQGLWQDKFSIAPWEWRRLKGSTPRLQ